MTHGEFDDPDWLSQRRRMVEEQIRARGIRDQRLLAVLEEIPREIFVPQGARSAAYDDSALPIGQRQTISQPYIVAYMTEQLALTPDCRVLEIGTGSGYQTAVLAKLARQIVSIERVEPLHRGAAETLARLGLHNVELVLSDGSIGAPQQAPFDRILITAAAPRTPGALVDQLSDGGILVAPIGGVTEQRIVCLTRAGGRTVETPLIACRFVKLIGREGWEEN